MFWIFKKNKKLDRCSYPHNTSVLWNKGIAMLCDKFDLDRDYQIESFADIKAGELVWIRSTNVESFFLNVFPLINNPFVLVTGDSVRSLPRELSLKNIREILAEPKLLHWFSQNCDPEELPQDKISPIPLGIDFHSQYEKRSWRFKELKTPQEQEESLLLARDQSPTSKICQVYADFHFNNTTRNLIKRDPRITKDRKQIYKDLKNNPALYFQKKRLPRQKLWQEMAKFEFIISPHGTGLDCHRTWEALTLGAYVIVEHSVLDSLYEGLPVKILEDYQEITQANLIKWSDEFRSRYLYKEYYPRLTNQYWIDRIRNKVRLSPPCR